MKLFKIAALAIVALLLLAAGGVGWLAYHASRPDLNVRPENSPVNHAPGPLTA